VDQTELNRLGSRYAKAWCSQDPEGVAAFYSKGGSISINGGAPEAIAKEALGFMTAFPDMVVTMDKMVPRSDGAEFRWTLDGTNTGPGGTGKHVHISGYEEWTFGADGLVARSQGHYDATEYERQLKHGVDGEVQSIDGLNVGVVLYTKGDVPGTLDAMWTYENAYSGPGIATGGPEDGFAGQYHVRYFLESGQFSDEYDLLIEKAGCFYNVSWITDGKVSAVGVGIEVENRLAVGWRRVD
jgi:hypothetical protein